MCGINGLISFSAAPGAGATVARMNAAVAHRGPDDRGVFVRATPYGGTLALGQVRLSIVDLSPAGHQPMFYSRTAGARGVFEAGGVPAEYAIVFNGEIYNFRELRAQLSAEGYVFSTQCDTEVILAAYARWGAGCVARFNGFWTFALYDVTRGTVLFSRDRFGKKPLYYALDERSLVFSSEAKGLLAAGVPAVPDPQALEFYCSAGFIPAPMSAFRGVRKLEAGHNAVLVLASRKLSDSAYFTVPKFRPVRDRAALIREGRELFEDAVRLRMFADVPVGAFLSGGLDSSSVVSAMTKFTARENLHTFSVGFDGKYDESPFVHVVREAFGTNHHHAYFRRPDFDALRQKAAFHYDEPHGDDSVFPSLFVSELARSHVTVALSGDGGDEVFGGYSMHRVAAQMALLRRAPARLRGAAASALGRLPAGPAGDRLRAALEISLAPAKDFYGRSPAGAPVAPAWADWSSGKLAALLELADGDFTQAMIDFDLFHQTLADNFLAKVDRASMAYALEVRCPLLDWRFIDFSRKIPSDWKADARHTKILMREIIADLVPPAILARGKKGFAPPVPDWLAEPDQIAMLREGLARLRAAGILPEAWLVFFSGAVLGRPADPAMRPYLVRLSQLTAWFDRWVSTPPTFSA